MAGIFNVITKFFGNKYDKDIKKIKPIILEIHKEYEKIIQLSNNDLREQTNILKNKITENLNRLVQLGYRNMHILKKKNKNNVTK